jgi:Flp pilus assembly protein TadG
MTGRDERGAATAELALSIPLLVSLTIGLVWLLSIGVAQIQMVDAAREAARATARGDPVGEAVAAGEQVAPGSTVKVSLAEGTAVATAVGAVAPPGGLLGFLPKVHLQARTVTAAESP